MFFEFLIIVPRTPFTKEPEDSFPYSLAISTASSTITLNGSFFGWYTSSKIESLSIAKSIGEICSIGQAGALFEISLSIWPLCFKTTPGSVVPLLILPLTNSLLNRLLKALTRVKWRGSVLRFTLLLLLLPYFYCFCIGHN